MDVVKVTAKHLTSDRMFLSALFFVFVLITRIGTHKIFVGIKENKTSIFYD